MHIIKFTFEIYKLKRFFILKLLFNFVLFCFVLFFADMVADLRYLKRDSGMLTTQYIGTGKINKNTQPPLRCSFEQDLAEEIKVRYLT